MINMNSFVKVLSITCFTFITFFSCSKDDSSLFKDCLLPWEDLETISQAEIPKEIVDFTYKTYPETDTLLAAVINFCNNEKRLYIQTEGTPNYDFLLYDSCGILIGKGKEESSSEIVTLLSKTIKEGIGNQAEVYDSFIINFENGTKQYVAEIYFQGDSNRYLFDKDGKIKCKLF